MAPFSLSLAVVSGVCFATGLFHLFIGLRRRGADMKHFTFGLFALAYSGAVLTGLLMYRAATLPQYLTVDRWSGLFAGVTYVFLIWFVAVYTDVRPLLVIAALTVLFAILVAAHLTRPTLIHGEILGIASVTLPWGEQISFLEVAESMWEILFLLSQLLTIGFLFYACFRQYRRGDRGEALALGAGLLLFVATLVFDFFVESGRIEFVLLSDFGLLPLAIVMSLRISNDVIRTEEELARYRGQLETLIQERTADLATANEQLEGEIAERRLAEETLHQRVEELAVLSRIAQMLATVTDLPLALERVCEDITHLLDAQVTYVVLPSNKEPQLQVMVGFNRESGPIGVTPLPVSLSETTYFGQVLSQAETLTLSDVQALSMAAPMHQLVARQRIQNAMLVPLVVRGSAIGLLAIATDQADQVFTSDQNLLAETIAADVAGAIENTRLFEQAQAAAVSEERARIARDLHDAVSQTIYSASLIAEVLPSVWARSPAEGERNLVKLRQLVRGALAEMRTLLFELRPTALEAADLDTLLHYLGDALTGRTRTPVEVIVEEAGENGSGLQLEVKLALYRIAQEAFNNIAKHSGATQATVTWHRKPERSTLIIQDNGRGFDPDSVSAARLGLSIMRERAEEIGAQLAIESQAGQGTRVAVWWQQDERPSMANRRRRT
jgi:signal transduction histidine kinase